LPKGDTELEELLDGMGYGGRIERDIIELLFRIEVGIIEDGGQEELLFKIGTAAEDVGTIGGVGTIELLFLRKGVAIGEEDVELWIYWYADGAGAEDAAAVTDMLEFCTRIYADEERGTGEDSDSSEETRGGGAKG
jgi:hypothetical protein